MKNELFGSVLEVAQWSGCSEFIDSASVTPAFVIFCFAHLFLVYRSGSGSQSIDAKASHWPKADLFKKKLNESLVSFLKTCPMASLPRSRGIKSKHERGKLSSASDDEDLEAVPLSHSAGVFNNHNSSATAPQQHIGGYSTLHNPLFPQQSTRRYRSLLLVTLAACGFIALCFLFSSFTPASSSSSIKISSPSSKHRDWPFITVQGTTFMEGCRPFFVTGINVDNLVEAAMADVSAAAQIQGPERLPGREMVRNLLHTAAKTKGLNVVRTWAHTTDPSHPIQDRPGEYSPDALEALDYVMAQAEAVGIRVQLSFVDMWRYRGGISEFVDWSRTAPKRDVQKYPPLIVEGDVTPE